MNNEPDLKLREQLLDNYNNKSFDKLLKKISELKNKYPRSLFLLNLLGNINNELGKYNEAIINFENIIKLNKNFADAYYNLGVIFKNINQIKKSMDNFEKCIRINPKKFEAYNNLGNIYRDKQKTDLAIINYLKSLEINPNYSIALQNFGVSLQSFSFTKYSYLAEKHIINLLEKNKILRPVDIINTLVRFVYLNTEYNSIINNYQEIEKKNFIRSIDQ